MAPTALNTADGSAAETPALLQRITLEFPASIWLVNGSYAPLPCEVAWLNPFEVNRALRFRDFQHQSRYRAAHVALRRIIAQAYGIEPAEQVYDRDTLGRWHLTAGGLDFSVSYAGSSAMIAVSASARLGIDIEPIRSVGDADELVEAWFDPVEREEYALIADAERSRAFLRGWTRKEAALKAIGVGLQREPATLHTGLDGRRSICGESRPIEIMSFECCGMIGAVARLVSA